MLDGVVCAICASTVKVRRYRLVPPVHGYTGAYEHTVLVCDSCAPERT